jgi:hypothetical protein
VSHPDDDNLNFPDFELSGEPTPPQADMAAAGQSNAAAAEGEPAFEALPGGEPSLPEPLGGLGEMGEPGAVPMEPGEQGEPLAMGDSETAGQPGTLPEFGGEPLGSLPEFGGEEPVAEEEPSKKKKKKKKGKTPKSGDSEELGEKGESFGQRLAKASPYTVMLWITLFGLLVGTLFLVLELKTYDFDFKAKTRVGAAMGVHSGPASTKAVA